MNPTIEELTWRGLIAHSTDLAALGAHLDAGPVKFYVGCDPTAASLHVGNLVQLLLAKRLQEGGHQPYMLVGGGTGLIGDPKDSGERGMNPAEVVAEWAARIRPQVGRFVSFDGPNAATMVNNYDWLSTTSVLDFLRDVGKHFPVNRMLARDVVARRLESGISYTEFSYVLLQSFDFRELYRRAGVTLQTGGSDQWGNLSAGVELIRRSDRGSAHAMATPLVTKADGTKFGKTASGAVWLDPSLTSPYAFHQFFLGTEDVKVADYLKIFTFRTKDEIDELAAVTAESPHLRLAQRALADDVTDLVHGRAEREAAVLAAAALFGAAELRDLAPATLEVAMREVAATTVGSLPSVADALALSGVVASKGAARRAIAEGGAYVNNVKVVDQDAMLSNDDLLAGRHIVLRRGRRTVGGITLG